MKPLTIFAAIALSAGAAPLRAQAPVRQPLPNDSVAIARRFVAWIWSSQVDSLLAHSPAAERTVENRQQTLDGIAQMQGRAGNEVRLVEERWVRRNGNRQYWRVAMFSDFLDEPVVLRLVISPAGELIGLGFNPLSRVPPIDAEP